MYVLSFLQPLHGDPWTRVSTLLSACVAIRGFLRRRVRNSESSDLLAVRSHPFATEYGPHCEDAAAGLVLPSRVRVLATLLFLTRSFIVQSLNKTQFAHSLSNSCIARDALINGGRGKNCERLYFVIFNEVTALLLLPRLCRANTGLSTVQISLEAF